MSDNNNVPSELPPAGWYPDPEDAARRRYWDGAQWTTHASPTDAAATVPLQGAGAGTRGDATPPAEVMSGGAAAVAAGRGLPRLKWWQWVLIGLGVLVLLSILINAVSGGSGSADASRDEPVAVVEQDDEPTAEPEPVDTSVAVPDVTGMTVADARAAIEAAGLTIAIDAAAGDDWLIVSHSPSGSDTADPGAAVTVVAEAPEPVYTLAQENAIRKAQSYLDFTGFSRQGLIEQLEFEGFSTEEATFGADNAGADWNAEAAEKAASYLELTSFSREGLYDQMAYEGFTDSEIQHALAAVGY